MSKPILFHDPTSEPSRAVHWFTTEAGIEVDLQYTWLTRGEHLAPEFLAINPGHQVPALAHDGLRMAEASAIMLYLVELHGIQDRWIGATAGDRAHTYRFLSWHHCNTRARLTLDYFLPALLMPAYHGAAPPQPDEIGVLRSKGRESLELLEGFLHARGLFLGGQSPGIADFFVASDLFALDIDPERDSWFDGLYALRNWLKRLRETEGYACSHRPWNAIVPKLRDLLLTDATTSRNNHWVADECAAFGE